ncbi:MAG TPA: amidase [Sporichthyaceae bacterium]|jgi:amidase
MELTHLTALQLAAAVAARELTAVEVVKAHLTRIEAVNPWCNAIVRVLTDSALGEAAALDARLAAGERPGPLAGVPLTVKENIDMAGLPTTHGVPSLADAVVPVDAPVVERMRAAGAIPIGRTNMPDMGLRISTDSSLHGLTRNPWHPDRTAAGSSGGEAASLATGMSALGLGNDIGGSLRNPASACGIASIRPSAGRVPDAGLVPMEDALIASQLMAVNGPMARTVADVRAALGLLNGHHPRDPWSVDVPLSTPAVPRRVAVVAEPPGGSTDPVVADAVRAAAAFLADAGYQVEEMTPPNYEEAAALWAQLLLGDLRSIRAELEAIMGADGFAIMNQTFAAIPALDGDAWSKLFQARHRVARAWSVFLAEFPLVLSPTWSQLPFEHGFDVTPEGTAAFMEMLRPVTPANLLGLPSACVPAARDSETGLPIGVLLTGARFADSLCLDAAEAVEARSPIRTPVDPVTELS